jgi:3-hydroxyisobutyrate dehydrogenase
MVQIGFVGLGHMGGPMAANLVRAGHQVFGFDLAAPARQAAAAEGIVVVDRIRDAVADADVVITMLPAGRHVREVLLGPDGAVEHSRPGVLVIDSSTIDVDSARHVSAALQAKGIQFVDAPVSGGVAKARAGTLTFMVGGDDRGFAAAQPILNPLGANIVHLGPAGAGTAAKICNNMLFGANLVATAEAFVLAERLGLDPRRLFGILTISSGDNWAVRNFCPVPGVVEGSAADEGYAPRFAASLMSKDLGLALDAAQSSGIELPVSARAHEVFGELAGTDGDLDASAVIHTIRNRA